MDLCGDFHIPQCDKEKCNRHLEELAQTMRKQDAKLIIVKQYPPCDSSEKCFKEAHRNCTFTILHKCSSFWKKIYSLQHFLLKDTKRVMCVTFKNDTRPAWEQTEKHHDFFYKLNVSDVSQLTSLNCFGKWAVEYLHQNDNKKEESFQKKEEEMGSFDEDAEKPDTFVFLPDLFGASKSTDVFVLKSCLEKSDNSVLQICSNAGKCSKLSQETKDDVSLPKLKGIFLKALPKMLHKRDVVGLAFLAVCGHNQVAYSAALLLQLTILKSNTPDPRQRINELIVVESLLWGRLLSQRHDLADEINQGSSNLFLRLAATYVMVLCSFIITCFSNDECQYIAETHLNTIEGRSLPKCQSDDEERREVCTWFDGFVRDATKRKGKQYKEILLKLEAEPKQLSQIDTPMTIQALVCYWTVKKIFESMDVNHLEFAKEFISQKSEQADDNLKPDAEKAAFEDVDTFCERAMGVVNLSPALNEHTAETNEFKMDPLLQMLYFNQNPSIREAIMKPKTGEKLFTSNTRAFILNEIKRILYPLLTLATPVETKYQNRRNGPKWITYGGKFSDSKVFIHIYLPLCKDVQTKLKTTFTDEDVYYNEMITLRKLQHKHIIKMVAFQDQYTPQFYILEQHPDLQTVLKNKKNNQDYAQKAVLVKYLVHALEAVEFCHSMSLIHRNLTAKSLVLVDNESVKLSSFHLCLKMTDGEAAGKGQTNDLIPTRWSAPESLKNNKYSTMSDVWMFGHLIYEVLTHGNMPYADLDESPELIQQIINGEIHLSEHRLIQRTHYNLILECTCTIPEERPALYYIKKSLEQKNNVAMSSLKPDQVEFEDFTDGHKPSTEYAKGIPKNFNPVLMEDSPDCAPVLNVVFISETIIKITQEHMFIFREKLCNMSPEVRIKISNDYVADVFPYMKIKESTKEMPHIECKIPRLPCGNQGQKVIDTSLKTVTVNKMLGDSVQPYIRCLYQMSIVLEKLHQKSWVIGDMSMPFLHIQQQSQEADAEVYFVSLSNLQYFDQEADNEDIMDVASSPNPTFVISRAAPEVTECGMLSPWSDVYCFGQLIWETMMTFDGQANTQPAFKQKAKEDTNSDNEKVSEKWETNHKRPKNCPIELYELMLNCTQHNSRARLSSSEITQQLRRIMQIV